MDELVGRLMPLKGSASGDVEGAVNEIWGGVEPTQDFWAERRKVLEEGDKINQAQGDWPMARPANGSVNERFVYFVKCRASGCYKIGSTGNLRRRVYEIRQYLPRGIEAVWWTHGGEFVERGLHYEFSDLRISGEWFEGDVSIARRISSTGAMRIKDDALTGLRKPPTPLPQESTAPTSPPAEQLTTALRPSTPMTPKGPTP